MKVSIALTLAVIGLLVMNAWAAPQQRQEELLEDAFVPIDEALPESADSELLGGADDVATEAPQEGLLEGSIASAIDVPQELNPEEDLLGAGSVPIKPTSNHPICRGEQCKPGKGTLVNWVSSSDDKGYHFAYKVSDGTEVSQTGKLVKNEKGYGEGCDRSAGAECSLSSSLSGVPTENPVILLGSDTMLDARFEQDTLVADDVSLLDILTGPVAPVKCPKQPEFLCPIINSKPDCSKCLFCPLKDDRSSSGKLQFCPHYDCKKCPRNEHHGGGKGEEYVMVVPHGHYEFITRDCYHVSMDYEAGLKGTIIKDSSVKKIKGCIPSGGGYECGTGATLDRSGNPCTGSESPSPI